MKINRSGLSVLLAALLVVGMVSAVYGAEKHLTVATASMGGAFYPIGNGIAEDRDNFLDKLAGRQRNGLGRGELGGRTGRTSSGPKHFDRQGNGCGWEGGFGVPDSSVRG